jgi:hypothetical protein
MNERHQVAPRLGDFSLCKERRVDLMYRLAFAAALAAASTATQAVAEESPKRGGTLTYLIAADAPRASTGTANRPSR